MKWFTVGEAIRRRAETDLFLHRDRNTLGNDRWIVRHVQMIPEQELQRMFTGRQLENDFRLPVTEMSIVIGRRHR